MLGARGHSDWLDVSEHVLHFTKGGDQVGYETIMRILSERVLRRGPGAFGLGRRAAERVPALLDSQRAVCLSEVPIGFTQRLAERRASSFGLAFSKQKIMELGGSPVWYVPWNGPQHKALKRLVKAAENARDISADIWSVTPFIDVPSSGTAPYQYDFTWEREWRVRRDVAFELTDVTFLLIPEACHEAAHRYYRTIRDESFGADGYLCPYIDPTWPVERVRAALAQSAAK